MPIAARFLSVPTTPNLAMAGMIAAFIAALSYVGMDVHRSILRNLRTGLDLEERTRELESASIRLREEAAQHRATEAELRQARKVEALGQLTGGIAHDFNNLLAAVIGNLELASALADEKQAPLLQGAMRAADRGAALTRRLLAFARKQRLDPRPTDVTATIGGLEDMLRRTLGPSIRLAVKSASAVPPALVDANQLELAVLNLTINARDAMPGGGTLRIELTTRRHDERGPKELAAGDYVVLAIIDDGIGMDPVTLSRAIEPFFTTKEVGLGSGLGLAMVHGFAAQSGGAMAIHSAPGEGTAVEIWLPWAAPASSREPRVSRSPATAPRGTGHVLLCDDDADVRAMIGETLRRLGYTVSEADRPTVARRLLAAGAPADLLIADYSMPEMNGLELIHETQELRPGLKTLLITGHADGSQRALDEGVPLLVKPFRSAQLAQSVANLLDGEPASSVPASACP
jgi:signal transduction histidine kinase/CheY-like chemotaxis protein